MEHPCKMCNGISCCRGKETYCTEADCCDPFLCLCSGLEIKEQISKE